MSIDEHKTKPAGLDVCPTKRKQLDLSTVKAQFEAATDQEIGRAHV